MNTLKKVITLTLLLITQVNKTMPADHSLENSSLRVIGLTLVGGALTAVSLATLKNLIDKIIEENPSLAETDLRKKLYTTLRYGFGFTTSIAGLLLGLATIGNSDNKYFLQG